MSLHLLRATRTDQLADALAGLLAVPPDDPFATDLVAVPTPGVERWLAQHLSHRLGASGPGRGDGVTAGVAFWPLRRLVAAAQPRLLVVDCRVAVAGGGEVIVGRGEVVVVGGAHSRWPAAVANLVAKSSATAAARLR